MSDSPSLLLQPQFTTAMNTAETSNTITPTTTRATHSSTGDMKHHLQNLLDSKEKQLQQAATLGQRVLAQRVELEERIRQLQEMDADKVDEEEIDSEARERYRELAETIEEWDTENSTLSSAFGTGKQRYVNGSPPSPTMPFVDLPLQEPDRSKSSAGTSAAQSRRAKNAAHRADDVEFAFEIGSGLLTEVRRLQSLLAERDKAIQDMKEEKDDLEKSVDNLRTALRQQEQSADKYKEENWNLEVALQELRTQLSDSQTDTLRLEGEHKRLNKLLSAARDAGDQHKNEAERLKNALEDTKAKHETDIAHARKHAAGLQRDKSDLQQVVESLKTDAAKAKRLPRFGSPITPSGPDPDFHPTNAGEDDVFSAPSTNTRKRLDTSDLFPADAFAELVDASPDPSPSKPFLASNHPNNEIEALQQRLSHAQRQVNTLKGTLQREKELRINYKRQLDSPGAGLVEEEEPEEDDQGDIGYEDELKPGKPKARSTPVRSTGRLRAGRGRAKLTLAQRLALASGSPSSEFDYEADVVSAESPSPSILIRSHQPGDEVIEEEGDKALEEEEPEEEIQRSPSPSPLPGSSNRTSVDGMDPAFANVLHRTPSLGSSPYNRSPLHQSVVAARSRGGTWGRRRGAAYQEVRPSSLVAQPEALAAELGLGMDTLTPEQLLDELLQKEHEHREMADTGCQTEVEEVPPVVALPEVAPTVVVAEIGVQAEPEPVPEVVVPIVVTCDGSVQTDDAPIAERAEMAVQFDSVEERPAAVSASTSTDTPVSTLAAEVEIQTAVVETADVDTQTSESPPTLRLVEKVDADVQTTVVFPDAVDFPAMVEDARRRERIRSMDTVRGVPIGHYDLSALSGAELSGDTTIRGPLASRFLDEGLEDVSVGHGTTETDADEYHDARQSIRMSTPSGSVDDFHSVMTMTDNDFSESDDESIKASRIPKSGPASLAQRRPSSFYAPKPVVSYESKEVSAQELKAELKEISIQTDEWTPPVTAVTPPAVPAPSFGLYRVGPSGPAAHQFQFIPPPPSTPSPTTPTVPIVMPVPSTVIRDSVATFGARPHSAHADRRRSIESAMSSVADESPARPRVASSNATVAGSNTLTVVDKTKPPMIALPPPPRLPPPPSSMPPPNFIPERKNKPPPRPSSPPPPDLIQRATTPLGSVLSVQVTRGQYGRQHGASMPPLQAQQQGLRQLPSTSSFRSAANAAATYVSTSPPSNSTLPVVFGRREMSSTSLASDRSSISSERHQFPNQIPNNANRRQAVPPDSPVTQNKDADTMIRNANSTDPAIIHSITQTMIGEFLYKYTRKTIGKGHGEKRHKRFFWVHPYTKTLYWSSADPGSSNVSESSAKSAYIDGVRSVLDPNPMPPGLYQYSVVVSTPQREMKFTAPTKERHDIWLSALRYLLSRPGSLPTASSAPVPQVPESPSSGHGDFIDDSHRPQMQPSLKSQGSPRGNSFSTTPRGRRNHSQLSVGGSLGKRSGTAAAEYLRWVGPESPYSPTKSFEHIGVHRNEEDLDFELNVDSKSDEGFEGLENVRACCDGLHTVGHHHLHHPLDAGHNGHGHPEPTRPVSPSGWSFRSIGSSHSHEGGIFAWGRREEGKPRFSSRRSASRPVPTS